MSVQEFNPIACTADRPNARGEGPRGERTLARVHRGQWFNPLGHMDGLSNTVVTWLFKSVIDNDTNKPTRKPIAFWDFMLYQSGEIWHSRADMRLSVLCQISLCSVHHVARQGRKAPNFIAFCNSTFCGGSILQCVKKLKARKKINTSSRRLSIQCHYSFLNFHALIAIPFSHLGCSKAWRTKTKNNMEFFRLLLACEFQSPLFSCYGDREETYQFAPPSLFFISRW